MTRTLDSVRTWHHKCSKDFFFFFKFVSQGRLTALLANLALSTWSRRVNGQKNAHIFEEWVQEYTVQATSQCFLCWCSVCQCLTKRSCVDVIEISHDQGSAKMSTIFEDIEKHQGTPKKRGATRIWVEKEGKKWVKNTMCHKQFLMAVIALSIRLKFSLKIFTLKVWIYSWNTILFIYLTFIYFVYSLDYEPR